MLSRDPKQLYIRMAEVPGSPALEAHPTTPRPNKMRIRILSLALLAIALPLSSCSERAILEPLAVPSSMLSNHMETSPPDIRISEIHYDNAGTDAGEAVEISGPAGASVEGWRIWLYNGNGGASYTPTTTL